MNREDYSKRVSAILAQIEEFLKEEEFDVEREEAASGTGVEVLVHEYNAGVNNEPVLSSVYFLPLTADEQSVLYMIHNQVIRDDIENNEKKALMLQAASLINYYNPYGSFILNETLEIISYRTVNQLFESMDDDQAAVTAMGQLGSGFSVLGIYIAVVNALYEERISWEDFAEIITGLASKE